MALALEDVFSEEGDLPAELLEGGSIGTVISSSPSSFSSSAGGSLGPGGRAGCSADLEELLGHGQERRLHGLTFLWPCRVELLEVCLHSAVALRPIRDPGVEDGELLVDLEELLGERVVEDAVDERL